MPYIVDMAREDIKAGLRPRHPGELNFAFCDLIIHYVASHRLDYQTINDVIGALEGAKAEFQRKVVAPYENRKAEQNGDLPWPH